LGILLSYLGIFEVEIGNPLTFPHLKMFTTGTLKTPICAHILEDAFKTRAILAHPTSMS